MKQVLSTMPVFVFILSSFTINAQTDFNKYEIGLNAGAYIYQGDLAPSFLGSFKTPAFVIGITGTKRLNNLLGLRLDLSTGKLKGDESKYSNPDYRRERAFAFETGISEVSVSIIYHPLTTDFKISPYLYAGVGAAFVDINRDYSSFNAGYFGEESNVIEGLSYDVNRSLPHLIPNIPLGVGVRYNLNDNVSLNSEVSYRLMYTDYLDGFSLAADPKQQDHYYKYSLGISFSLGSKNNYRCPTVN